MSETVPPREDEGAFLKQAIGEFYEEQSEESLLIVLITASQSSVLMLNEQESGQPVSLVRTEGESYLPVFSGQEELGAFQGTPVVDRPFSEVITLARDLKGQGLSGVIINPATEPMQLPWEALDIVEAYQAPASDA